MRKYLFHLPTYLDDASLNEVRAAVGEQGGAVEIITAALLLHGSRYHALRGSPIETMATALGFSSTRRGGTQKNTRRARPKSGLATLSPAKASAFITTLEGIVMRR